MGRVLVGETSVGLPVIPEGGGWRKNTQKNFSVQTNCRGETIEALWFCLDTRGVESRQAFFKGKGKLSTAQ